MVEVGSEVALRSLPTPPCCGSMIEKEEAPHSRSLPR